MITIDDIKRLQLFKLENRYRYEGLTMQKKLVKSTTTDWAKNYWYNVFSINYVRNMVVMTISERQYTK